MLGSYIKSINSVCVRRERKMVTQIVPAFDLNSMLNNLSIVILEIQLQNLVEKLILMKRSLGLADGSSRIVVALPSSKLL